VSDETARRIAAARATLWVALSACGFGAIAIFATFGTRAGAPLLNLLAWRYLLAAIVLGAMGMATRTLRANRSSARVVLLAGLGQTLVAVVSLSALRYIPAATLSFLFYTFPAWVAVIARVRHSEPLTRRRLFALALSLSGVFVMVGSPGGAALHTAGVALALSAALLYAIYIPMIASLQRGHGPLATATYMSAGAAVIITCAAALRGEFGVAMAPTAWTASIGLALVSTVGAFLLFLRGLAVLGPVRTAIISTVEPFVTAMLGAWLLQQPLTLAILAGGALIAAAVVLLQVPAPETNSGRSG
jgi:drug/metabolite transporter (DMT)-like permease